MMTGLGAKGQGMEGQGSGKWTRDSGRERIGRTVADWGGLKDLVPMDVQNLQRWTTSENQRL